MTARASVLPERDNRGMRWWAVYVTEGGHYKTFATRDEADAEAARINAGGAL